MSMSEALGLKIYGLTKVWPKWQVIIPKECRDDFHAEIGDEYELVMIDRKTFGIGSAEPCQKIDLLLKNFRQVESLGLIKIGTKYQFVIPSFVRKELGIQAGDNLLVLGKERGLGFIKNDNLEFVLEYLKNVFAQAS